MSEVKVKVGCSELSLSAPAMTWSPMWLAWPLVTEYLIRHKVSRVNIITMLYFLLPTLTPHRDMSYIFDIKPEKVYHLIYGDKRSRFRTASTSGWPTEYVLGPTKRNL